MMKIARCFRMAGVVLFCWLVAGATVLPEQLTTNLEQERKNDDQMWQLMRQMLVDFGYTNKVAILDTMWQKTATPQQWADNKHRRPVEQPLITPATERILAQLPLRPTVDFSQFLTDVCTRGGDLREIMCVLVAWMGRGGQAVVQGRGGEWSYHFICGAACQLSLGLGYFAAVMNERLAVDKDSDFDRDDMALAMAGAEWAYRAEREDRKSVV